jgi:hypothetical protein
VFSFCYHLYGGFLLNSTNLRSLQNADVSDTYIEVIGRVTNSTTVQMHVCISMGSDLGVSFLNDNLFDQS